MSMSIGDERRECVGGETDGRVEKTEVGCCVVNEVEGEGGRRVRIGRSTSGGSRCVRVDTRQRAVDAEMKETKAQKKENTLVVTR